jgi:phenylacetate-CoA ligase
VPAIRAKIENAWGATLIDHSGASEVGPWGCGDAAGTGLHVIESEFIAEFLPVDRPESAANGSDETTADDALSELVITSLGRDGSPVVRYRTGDLVRPQFSERGFVFLPGGVLGRVDDMMIVRGVNVFPTAIEHILRGFPEVLEYRMIVRKIGAMDALEIEVEDTAGQPERIAHALRVQLGLSVSVSLVQVGSLPRYEAKAARFIDLRRTAST